MTEKYQHTTVLLDEAVKGLNIQSNGVYLDATFGRGGHSRLILSLLGKQGRLLAIDRDSTAIAEAQTIKDPRFKIIHGPFSAIAKYMAERNLQGLVNGILIDLGVSEPQLKDPERGFSFTHDGPLDMRMDTSSGGKSAAEWLRYAPKEHIAWVLRTFGEERFARRIAQAIIEQRRQQPLTRTGELARLIINTSPFSHKHKHKHPATRSFQAVRIYINSELEEIKHALDGAMAVLAPKGRLSVISFHSLEDKLVKNFIRQHSQRSPIPIGLPLTEVQINKHYQDKLQLKAMGKIQPSKQEIYQNIHARSALLRIAEKLPI